MHALLLALAVAATPGLQTKLPPVPRTLYRVAWQRPFVPTRLLEWKPLEAGGVAVDPATGVAVFGTRDGWLHAVREDGKVAWEVRGAGGFGAPAIEGDVVYAGSSDGKLYAVGLADGKQRWTYDAKEELATRPAVADGLVYVASLQDTVFAIDAATGAWRWHHRREGREGFSIHGAASVVAAKGTVFGAYSDGTVAALDAATGAARWERQVAPTGAQRDVDGLASDGARLYAAAYSGAVLALDPADGHVVWSFEAPGASRVAVNAGLVVAVGTSGVHGLGALDGAHLWTAPLAGAPAGEPAVAGKWALVPAREGGLRWVEAASGRTVRVFDPGTGVSAAPGVAGTRVYVLSNGGDLFALELP